jgi:HK97 family phage major capsid protein
MGVELAELVREAKGIRDAIGTADDARSRRLDAVEKSVNERYLKANRPGLSGAGHDDIERKDAIEFCRIKHELSQPKNDGLLPVYTPSSSEIEDATLATKALHSLFRHGNVDRVEHKKSLSSFSFGSNQFILAPEMSNRVLSCLVDPSDVAGLMGQETTTSGSLKFLIDNVRMGAAFACEATCFANNPQPDLQEGLGELEIKPETLRCVICATSDLLQDASFNAMGAAQSLQRVS